MGAGFADYHAATAGADGLLRAELTNDGLHPNAAGYQLMQPVIESALEKVLR
jgi:acyl-CoA thioesterase I